MVQTPHFGCLEFSSVSARFLSMHDVSKVAIYPDIWANDSCLAGSLLHLNANSYNNLKFSVAQ